MTISTMQATRGKAPAATKAAGGSEPDESHPPKHQRGALADIAEVGWPAFTADTCGCFS